MKNLETLTMVVFTSFISQGCAVSTANNKDEVRGNAADLPGRSFVLSKAAPTIIYVHGCGGTDGASLEWAKRINSWGYNVLIADDLEQKKPRSACASFGIQDVGYQERMESVIAAAHWIGKQPWHAGKIGTIGFSTGGTTLLNIGANTKTIGTLDQLDSPIKAGVAYYPHCQSYHGNPNIPVQIHIGQNDDWTRSENCGSLNNYKNYDVNVYDGTQHGFDTAGFDGLNKFGHMVQHDAEVSRIAEEKTRQFFQIHIKPH